MNADKALTIVASIVSLAVLTTILRNGTNTARVVNAFAGAFQGSLRAAMGS